VCHRMTRDSMGDRHDRYPRADHHQPQDAGHSFDIDSLDFHVEPSPNSATAVRIRPTERGQPEFYCSVHTHREAGMVGAITVE